MVEKYNSFKDEDTDRSQHIQNYRSLDTKNTIQDTDPSAYKQVIIEHVRVVSDDYRG